MGAPTQVSAEASGKLRLLTARLEVEARKIEQAADKVPRRLLRDLALKAEIGRARTLARILAAMPLRPFHCDGRSVAFRYLKPLPAVPAAAGAEAEAPDGQPCVAVFAVLVNSAGRPRMSREPFGACFTRHALGRLLDRSGMRADPVQAMLTAHDELAALGAQRGAETFGQRDFLLPCGGGCFSGRPRKIGSRQSPLFVARTWIDVDMTGADQSERLAEWHRLADQAA